jgi:hypothetical protein
MPTKKPPRDTPSSVTEMEQSNEERQVSRKKRVSTKRTKARVSRDTRAKLSPEVQECLEVCSFGLEVDMSGCEGLQGEARARCISAARRSYRACCKSCLGHKANVPSGRKKRAKSSK